MYQKIYNPQTNRKVSIYSKSGRLILLKYLKQIGGHTRKCALINGSCKQTEKEHDKDNCELREYPSGFRCVRLKSSSSTKPGVSSSTPVSVSTPSIVTPSISSPTPVPVPTPSIVAPSISSPTPAPVPSKKPSPISSKTTEIISREMCGINPDTGLCNAKFKDDDCIQIRKNGRNVCVKADSITEVVADTPAVAHTVTPDIAHTVTPTVAHTVTPDIAHTVTPTVAHTVTPAVAHTVTPASSSTIPLESKYVFDNRFPDDGIEYLYGPISLDYYKFNVNGVTKKILLMADMHTSMEEFSTGQRDTAITSDEFIVYLSQSCANLNKCVDFYLETSLSTNQGNPYMSGGDMYVSKNIPSRGVSSLAYIRGLFEDCSYQNYLEDKPSYARDCTVNQYQPQTMWTPTDWLMPKAFPIDTRLDNLRVHNIDIRLKAPPTIEIPYDRPIVSHYLTKLVHIDYRLLFEYALGINTISQEDITKMIESYLPPPPYPITIHLSLRPNIIRYIRAIELMKKKVEKEERKFIHYNIFERVASASTSAVILNGIRNTIYEKYFANSYLDVLQREIDITCALHDMYTMIRMFKNFDTTNKKGDRGPNRCKKISQQNNIIVYAGGYHIGYFRAILGWLSTTEYISDFKKYSIEQKVGPSRRISKILTFNKDDSFESYNALMRDFCGE